MEILRPLIFGRSVLVVGSGPLEQPIGVPPEAVVICVNGSVSSVPKITPDLWLLNSRVKPKDRWTRDRRFLHETMMQQGRKRHIGIVGYLTRQPGAEDYTAEWLDELGTTYDRSIVIDRSTREQLEIETGARTVAMRKDACSAGVFGVIVALAYGASRIRMVGFSYERGYNYLPGHNLPVNARAHVQGDRLALREIAGRYPGLVEGVLVPKRSVA